MDSLFSSDPLMSPLDVKSGAGDLDNPLNQEWS